MTNSQIDVIVETPKGSSYKYIWDEARGVIRLKKAMPFGFVFPFNFGMVPHTRAEDGDPIDVVLLSEHDIAAGTFVQVRIIAALKANQTKGKTVRNDRLIAILPTCPMHGHWYSLGDIINGIRNHVEDFFRSYNQVQGKQFSPLGWADTDEALELLSQSLA